MNLVGKIFIVLIFVMCLVWMGFSVAVYATHKNWKEIVEDPENGLKFQVDRANEDNEELKDQKAKLESELAAEKAARRQVLAKLEMANAELKRQLVEQERDLNNEKQKATEALARLRDTEAEIAELRIDILGGTRDGQQVVGYREEIRQAQADRDKYFDELVKATDQLHQAANEYRALRARTTALAADLADAKEVLRLHDLQSKPAVYQGTPPTVDGVVLKVGADGLLEISIGSDDGLLKGHTLEVVRQGGGVSTYLGRIVVTETSPDKSVCKVLPAFLQGAIQRNDRVTSKLK